MVIRFHKQVKRKHTPDLGEVGSRWKGFETKLYRPVWVIHPFSDSSISSFLAVPFAEVPYALSAVREWGVHLECGYCCRWPLPLECWCRGTTIVHQSYSCRSTRAILWWGYRRSTSTNHRQHLHNSSTCQRTRVQRSVPSVHKRCNIANVYITWSFVLSKKVKRKQISRPQVMSGDYVI